MEAASRLNIPWFESPFFERALERADLEDEMRELASEGMTMIVVTHEMGFAREVAHQVVFMDGGVVVEHGKPADVLENPKQERTKRFLGLVLEH